MESGANYELSEVLDTYLLPLRRIENIISEKPNGNILVEAPLGFKELGLELVRYLGKKGFNASLSGRNTWGSCDFSLSGNYDFIIHLGHALPPNILHIINNNLKIERHDHGDIVVIRVNDGTNILFSPAYYKPQPELLNKLEDSIQSFVKDNPNIMVTYALPYKFYAHHIASSFKLKIAPNPITGCFVGFPIPNSILFVGSGYFYPLTFKFLKPHITVYLLDIFRGVLEDIEYVYRKYLSMKVKAINEFISAKRVGIIVSRKPGQQRLDLVNSLIIKLRDLGKEVIIVDADEVSPDVVNNLPVNAVVNTACPRVGIDDLDRFMKPIVNAGDVLRQNILDLNNLLSW